MKNVTVFILTVIWSSFCFSQTPFFHIADSLCKKFGYDYISEPEYNGLALIRKNGGLAFYDTLGNRLDDGQFENIDYQATNDGYIPISKNGKWGVINENMEVILPFEYDEAPLLSKNFFILCKKNEKSQKKYALYALKENTKSEHIYDDILYKKNGYISLKKENTFTFLDEKSMKTMFSIEAERCEMNNYLILAQRKVKDTWEKALYNYAGETLVSWGKYDDISIQNNHSFLIKKENKWGLIDSIGQLALPPIYSKIISLYSPQTWDEEELIISFRKNYFFVYQHDTLWVKDTIVAPTDNFPIQAEGINSFACEKKTEKKLYEIVAKMGAFDFIHSKWFFPIQEKIIHFRGNYWILSDNQQSIQEVYDVKNTHKIATFHFDAIEDIYQQQLTVQKAGKLGVIDFQGNMIVPFEYHRINLEGNVYICETGMYRNREVTCYHTSGKQLMVKNYANLSYQNAKWDIYSIQEESYDNVPISYTYVRMDKKGNILQKDIANIQIIGSNILYQTHKKYTFVDTLGNDIHLIPNPKEYNILYDYELSKSKRYLEIIDEKGKSYYFDEQLSPYKPNKKEDLANPHFTFFKKDEQIGIKNKDGKEIIPTILKNKKDVVFFQHIIGVILPETWGFCNPKGEVLQTPIYNKVSELRNNFLTWEINNQGGIYHIPTQQTYKMYSYYYSPLTSQEIVCQNDTYGLIDSTGKLLIPCQYQALINIEQNVYLAMKDSFWGIIDSHNQIVLRFEYDIVNARNYKKVQDFWRYMNFAGNAFCKSKDGKFALFHVKQKRFVTDFEYDLIAKSTFTGEYAVNKNGKWGLISEEGKVLVPCLYPAFYEHRGACGQDRSYSSFRKQGDWIEYSYKEYGTLYKAGKQVYPYQKHRFILARNGFFFQLKDQKYTLFTPQNQKVALNISDAQMVYKPQPTSGDYLIVEEDKKVGVIDATGERKIPLAYASIESHKDCFIVKNFEGKKGVIDKHYQWVLNTEWDAITILNDSLFLLTQNNKMGIWQKSGKWQIPLIYDGITKIFDNTCIVSNNGKCALADHTGKLLTDFLYDGMSFLDNHLGISIKIDCKFGVMNYQGKVVVEPKYDMIVGEKHFILTLLADKYGIINATNYTETLAPIYSKITKNYNFSTEGDYGYDIIKEGKKGLIDSKGEWVLPTIYQNISYNDGYFIVTNAQKQMAVIDRNQTPIIEFGQFDEIREVNKHTYKVTKNRNTYTLDKQLRIFSKN